MFLKLSISRANIGLILLSVLFAYTNAQSEDTATSDKVIKEKPIVIQTQVQNYDQPTLGEYQICHENLDKCLAVCATAANQTACESECPTCPILINQDVVVQGVNDTDYRTPSVAATGNTTTIIRLTNEIHNIIDNKMGNITALNQNNIHVHQNISTSGGKFGLGFNQNGSCCIVVSPKRRCNSHSFSTASRCHRKRHRFCGERCTARVLYARRVTKCTKPSEDDEMPSCRETIIYEAHPKAAPHTRKRSHCEYTTQWPFVSCHGRIQQHDNFMEQCERCYKLPYINVIMQRIPRRCRACFNAGAGYSYGYGYVAPFMQPPPCYVTNTCYSVYPGYPYSPPSGNDGFDFEDEEFLPDDDWNLESTKCRNADGTISENCHDHDIGSGDGRPNVNDETAKKPPVTDNPLEQLPEAQDEVYDEENDDDYNNENDEDYLDGPEIVRRRRKVNGFKRSIYSQRHRNL